MDKEKIISLYLTGLSIRQVAKVTGYGHSSIGYFLKKEELSRKTKGGHPRTLQDGDRRYHSEGYILVYNPTHLRANGKGFVYEHILVWEQTHSKLLPQGWSIHHRNTIRDDNRPENLLALPKSIHNPNFHYRALQKQTYFLEKQLSIFRNKEMLESILNLLWLNFRDESQIGEDICQFMARKLSRWIPA